MTFRNPHLYNNNNLNSAPAYANMPNNIQQPMYPNPQQMPPGYMPQGNYPQMPPNQPYPGMLNQPFGANPYQPSLYQQQIDPRVAQWQQMQQMQQLQQMQRMQQQPPGYPPQQLNNAYPAYDNRFGSTANSAVTNNTITQAEQQNVFNRFIDQGDKQVSSNEELPAAAMKQFICSVNKGFKFNGNDTIELNSVTEVYKAEYLAKCEEVAVFNSKQECFEDIVEQYLTNKDKFVITKKYITTTRVFNNIDFNKDFYSLDVKNLYKALKAKFKETTNRSTAVSLLEYDASITELVNDYLSTLDFEVSIDSFKDDFNDLLKVLRNQTEDEEDNLNAYINNYLTKCQEAHLIVSEALSEDEIKTSVFVAPITVVFIPRITVELGIENVGEKTLEVVNHSNNNTIRSLAFLINKEQQESVFYLVTMDRNTFKLKVKDDKVYINRV